MRPLGATSTAATGFWSVSPWARTRARSRGPRSEPGSPALRHRRHPVGDDAGGPGLGGPEDRPRGRARLRLVGQVAGAGRLRGNLLEKGAQLVRRHAASLRGDEPASPGSGRASSVQAPIATSCSLTAGGMQRSRPGPANLTERTKVRAAP